MGREDRKVFYLGECWRVGVAGSELAREEKSKYRPNYNNDDRECI